jgi:L-methionine (R)-S-oxide reductase
METVSRTQSRVGKDEQYRALCEQLVDLIGTERNLIANAANTAALLFGALPDVNWVGFYMAHGEELVLGPFQGKPACARIAFGKGACGQAAAAGETVLVPDVSQFAGYIACDPASRSEIVVPLLNWGNVLGVLDIDSASLHRFDDEDREGIESLVAVFLSCQMTENMPDLNQDTAN